MRIEDKFSVRAPIEDVWDFLLDMERVGQAMPGVQSVEAIDDRSYRGQLKVKVGPISATFGGVVRLTEIEPPHRMVAEAEAEDKAVASAVKIAFTATLAESGGQTHVTYVTDVTVRGRLGQFGSAVMGGTAKKMTAQFVKNVKAELEG